jgi:riboflavin biosynthesis pyrimidine reductase
MTGPQQRWRDAFSSFIERKTQAAIMAATPPYLTVFSAPEGRLVAVGNTWSDLRFDGPFYVTTSAESGSPTCSLVFVQSANGNTGASDPSSLGGGQTDMHVIYEGLSRVAADAVFAGAGTVRGGRAIFSVWHPALVDLRRSLRLPRHPVQVVATLKGFDLDHGLLFNVPDVSVILLTVSGGAATMERSLAQRPWIRLIVMRRPGDLAEAIRTLRELKFSRLSCVGGRTLATELLDLNLVDDVYLTTSQKPGGEPGTPMYPRRFGASLIVRKRGTAEESGVLFEHFHLPRATTQS